MLGLNLAMTSAGSNAPKLRVCRLSRVGIITLVLGRYLLFQYLDPSGKGQ